MLQGSNKIKTLLLALSLGAVATAGAQTYAPPTGDVADTPSGSPATMPQPLVNSPPVAPPLGDASVDVPSVVPTTYEAIIILHYPNVLPGGLDSRADSKCRNAAVNEYWDCVNSSNGGQ